MRIVKQNIVFAISIKALVLVLSAVGIATMWEAVFRRCWRFSNCSIKCY